jgi:hypothetical protein
MGRKLDPAGLIGTREIAERLGAKRPSHVHRWWKSDPTFPEPVAVLGAKGGRPTYIWYWPDVERWGRATGRFPRSKGTPSTR